MDQPPLTGAQKSFLRGRGQQLDPALVAGRNGLTAGFFAELERQLRAHELVKLRLLDADRHERAAWCERIAADARCTCVGAVGRTALFYRANPEPAERRIDLPA